MYMNCVVRFSQKPLLQRSYIFTFVLHLDTVEVYYSPTNAQVIVLKTILKLTLKYLRHVSVQSRHLQGAHYPCSLKFHFVKLVDHGSSVYD